MAPSPWGSAGVGLLLLILLSCTAPSPHADKSVFRINLSSGALESLDPAYAKDLYTMWSVHALYNTLTDVDSAGRLLPSLATRWESSDDGLQWIFHLRNDVFFQDNGAFPGGRGRRMTAGDVAFSFERILDPAVASSGAWIFNDRVDSLRPFEALDDTTLIIRMQQPFRPMPMLLSMPYCSVVPREVVARWGKDFRRHPCGTGPFQFFLWEEGSALILHRNPHYWQEDEAGDRMPYLDAVELSFYDSKATEFLLFLQHRLDFVNGLDGSFKDLVLTKNGDLRPDFASKYHLKKSVYLNTEYIGFLTDTSNALLRQSPTRMRAVRQAACYAIDRAQIARYFRNGIGLPANAGFIPPGMPGHDSSASFGYAYNPEKARKLLAEAGYPGGRGLGEIVILTPDNWADIVSFAVTQLAEVGIKARVEVMQPNILRQQMSSSQALCFRAQWIADYPDAETYLAFFYSKFPAPPNYTRFSNPTFDRLYESSMSLPDSARWIAYRRMDSIAMSEAPVLPLFYDQLLHFTQQNVEGFTSSPMNIIDLTRVRVKR